MFFSLSAVLQTCPKQKPSSKRLASEESAAQTSEWRLIISPVGRYGQTQTAHWTVDSAGSKLLWSGVFTRQFVSMLAVQLGRRPQKYKVNPFYRSPLKAVVCMEEEIESAECLFLPM